MSDLKQLLVVFSVIVAGHSSAYQFCWFQHNHVYNTLTADQQIFEVCEKHPEHRVFVGELPAKFVNGRYAGEPSDKGEQDE